ncbi:hypothetical protein SDC9_45881 [bioreactor metagenome]|uniref:DUF4249 domain-containing protein n=1 Tax=bioreactor metagenome TaxID=1076179 RepID=A0A644W7E6_9ZZZZ
MKKIFYLIIGLALLTSCEKEVNIDLPQPDSKLVVEGWIENGEYPVVIVSRNSSYFAPIDSSYLMDSLFITDALVIVSDGIQNDTLQLQFDFGALQNSAWPIIYYKGSKILGTEHGSYSLHIEAEGEVITGHTTIPGFVGFDSVWWEAENGTGDSLGYIHAYVSDNASEKNYYRIFSRRLGRDYNFIPVMESVYDDVFFNGLTFEYEIMRGEMSYENEEMMYEDPEFGYYTLGDTVIVKLSSIDREHYEFWRTLEEDVMAGGNPFTNPVTIRHNVEGAIGVFGGYGSVCDTLIIQ